MLDRFKITLEEYARLTDRQIFDLYLHARKSDGSIDPALPLLPEQTKAETPAPAAPPEDTYESESAALDRLADVLRMDGSKREALCQKLREKYGRSS